MDLNSTKWKHLVYFMYRIPVFYWLLVWCSMLGVPWTSLFWVKSLKQGFWCAWWACLTSAGCCVKITDQKQSISHGTELSSFYRHNRSSTATDKRWWYGCCLRRTWPGRAVACNYFSLCCYPWFGGTVHKLLFHCLLHQCPVENEECELQVKYTWDLMSLIIHLLTHQHQVIIIIAPRAFCITGSYWGTVVLLEGEKKHGNEVESVVTSSK